MTDGSFRQAGEKPAAQQSVYARVQCLRHSSLRGLVRFAGDPGSGGLPLACQSADAGADSGSGGAAKRSARLRGRSGRRPAEQAEADAHM
ncbi:hypothetical protein D3C74_324420 [compost metagenome]